MRFGVSFGCVVRLGLRYISGELTVGAVAIWMAGLQRLGQIHGVAQCVRDRNACGFEGVAVM